MCAQHNDEVFIILDYLVSRKELAECPLAALINSLGLQGSSTAEPTNLTDSLSSLAASLSTQHAEINNSKKALLKMRESLTSELARVDSQLEKDNERLRRLTQLQSVCHTALDFHLSPEWVEATKGYGSMASKLTEDTTRQQPTSSGSSHRTSEGVWCQTSVEVEDHDVSKAHSPSDQCNFSALHNLVLQGTPNETLISQQMELFEREWLVNGKWCGDSEAINALIALFEHLSMYPINCQLTSLRALEKAFSAQLIDNINAVAEGTSRLVSSEVCIKALVALLSSINDDVKSLVLTLLMAFFSTSQLHQSVENQFMEWSGLQAVMNIVGSSYSEFVLDKALAFLCHLLSDDGNGLTASEQLREMVVSLGGVQVIDLLYTDSIGILESASFVIDYASRSETAKDAFRELGTCERIVASLLHPSLTVKARMTSAVWNLSSSSDNRQVFRQLGIIPTLLGLLHAADQSERNDELRAYAAGALWNLSIDMEGKKHIVAYGGIESLLAVARSTQCPTVLENVIGTLLNTSVATNSRPVIRNANGIPVLLSILQSAPQLSGSSVKLLVHAAGTLRNCAIDDRNKLAIRECGGVQVLVSILRDMTDTVLIDKVASTLWILTVSPDIKCTMLQSDSLETVIQLLMRSSTISKDALCDRQTFKHVFPRQGSGVSPSLADSKSLINSFPSSTPSVSIRMSVREKLCGVVRNCCTLQQYRQKVLATGAVLALVGCLWDCFSLQTSFCPASTNASHRKMTSSIGCPSLQLCETVGSALWHLSRADKSTPRQQGGVEALCFLLSLPHLHSAALEEVAGALSSLTAGSRENAEEVLRCNGIHMLLNVIRQNVASVTQTELLSAPGTLEFSVSTLLNSLLAIRNSTTSSEQVLTFVVAYAILADYSFCYSLFRVMEYESEDCACEAVFIIKNLSAVSSELKSVFAKSINARLSTLMETAKSNTLRRASASTLRSLSDP